LKVRRGIRSLRTGKIVRELERSFAAACERDLASGMKAIGSRFARAVNRIFGRRGPVLVDRYDLHVLRSPAEVRRALAYVLQNGRRHLAKMGRALPHAAALDPASSGRWFSGWNRRFQPASSPLPAPVAPPRTWLLSIGWRKHGLIDPTEVPGR
jgi:hypothetical protein